MALEIGFLFAWTHFTFGWSVLQWWLNLCSSAPRPWQGAWAQLPCPAWVRLAALGQEKPDLLPGAEGGRSCLSLGIQPAPFPLKSQLFTCKPSSSSTWPAELNTPQLSPSVRLAATVLVIPLPYRSPFMSLGDRLTKSLAEWMLRPAHYWIALTDRLH